MGVHQDPDPAAAGQPLDRLADAVGHALEHGVDEDQPRLVGHDTDVAASALEHEYGARDRHALDLGRGLLRG